MAIESPDYEVVYERNGLEFRQYPPFLVAETLVRDAQSSEAATNEGFRRLFRYITGANATARDIDMTAPVLSRQSQGEKGTKIEMTTPVIQSQGEEGFFVSFVVPSEYSLTNVPRPTDERVRIREVPGRLVAVLEFSGRWTNERYRNKRAELEERLAKLDTEAAGPIEYARYNSPYSLPFLRRNEMLVPVTGIPASDEIVGASLPARALR